MDLGPRKELGGRIRPPNSDREPISNPNQPGGGGKRCDMSQAYEGGHGQAMVNRVSYGTGQEGDIGLESHDEPLLLQIPH